MLPPIEKSRVLPFAPSTIYAAWISSDTVIPPATEMDIDPHIGGHYRLIIDTPDFKSRCEGAFLHLEPDRRLTYTWQWQGDEEKTEIDVRFAADGDGTCVSLCHSGFVDEQSRSNHDHGWDSFFVGLEAFLEDQ